MTGSCRFNAYDWKNGEFYTDAKYIQFTGAHIETIIKLKPVF